MSGAAQPDLRISSEVGRLEEARTLMKAPDVLQILKDWLTPEERYEARKKSKNRF